ncbi:MAG: glycosyltransferase [Lachnospiraceae bacterium]|nr:glycosyltransferase [Lachnospiraceae bacterium]
MDVLYCFDEGYARVVATSLVSLLEHNFDVRLHLFKVSELEPDTYNKFDKLFNKYVCEKTFYNVEPQMKIFKEIFKQREVNIGMFARLLASSILPRDLDEVLYLDGDTLVRSEINLDDFRSTYDYISGVYDVSLPPMGVKEKLNLGQRDIYINSGVLYINLLQWRKEKIEEKIIEFLKENPDVTLFDQDVINYVCANKIHLVPLKYNMTFLVSELPYKFAKQIFEVSSFYFYSKKDLKEAQKQPCIIHFAGEVLGKPWTDISYIRYTEEWRKIDQRTPWGNEEYLKRKYSNKPIVAIYKKMCEKVINIFYQKKNYGMVSFLYRLLYMIPHKLMIKKNRDNI